MTCQTVKLKTPVLETVIGTTQIIMHIYHSTC